MSRIRDRSSTSIATGQYGTCNSSGTVTGTPVTLSTSVTAYDVMEDIVIPGFAKKRSLGLVFVNPMEKLTTSYAYVPANTYWSYRAPQGYNRWGTGQSWSLIDVTVDPRTSVRILRHPTLVAAIQAAQEVALTHAYAEAGKADAESLVSLGEMRETLAFLMSPIKAAISLTKRFNRFRDLLQRDAERFRSQSDRYSKLPKHLRDKRSPPVRVQRKLRLGRLEASDLSSLWLAYRYGLMPLVYDIQEHLDAFQKMGNRPITRQTARGKWDDSGHIDLGSTPSGDPLLDYWEHPTSLSYSIAVRAGVLYEPRLETVANTFGLELHRVPSALWEWVPLSFVADWVLNMSDFINAMSVHLRVERVLGSWVTTTVDFTYMREFHYRPLYSGHPGDGSFQILGRWKTRRPVSLKDIGLRVRVEMNGKRVADAFALLHTMLVSAIKRK